MRSRYSIAFVVAGALAILALGTPRAAIAQAPDAMSIAVVSAGHAKIRLTVTAGASGAPYGFEVCWTTAANFALMNSTWPAPGWAPGEGWVDYVGVGTANTWGSPTFDFRLAPNQSVDIELGDTFDETGVTGTATWLLSGATDYVFCANALGPAGPGLPGGGALSATLSRTTSDEGRHCRYSQGYWKTHAASWPVSSLTLGTVSYTAAQLLQILNTRAAGNGLVFLAHQLIAAKLNVLAGANSARIQARINSADARIGSLVVPPIGTGSLAPGDCSGDSQDLDDWNNDEDDHDDCGTVPVHGSTWGTLKSSYR